jgi:CHASE2 domain-containing sensor protein
MKTRSRRLVVLSGLVPTLAIAALSLFRPSFLADLEYSVYDVLVRSAPARPPDERIVIVDVDERSLSSIGQWPWRRDVVGDLLVRLRELGASAIALDIVFAESDRYEGADVAPDILLANALRPGRVVLGYALTFDPVSRRQQTCVQHPLGLAIVLEGQDVEEPFFQATGAVCNLEILTQAAAASGFLNAAPDPDGRLRRAPLVAEFGDRVYPSLALAAVSAITHPRTAALKVANANASSLMLDGRTVPLDGKSNLLLRYRGPKRTFPYISAVDVFTGDVRAGAFRDKLVFVGTTALGTREVVSTPLDTLFTGVEVQATVADNLLQQDFIHRPEHGIALETQAAFGLCVLAIVLSAFFGVGWGALAVAGSMALVWGASVWLIATDGTLLSPLFPTLGLATALAAMTAARVSVERRRADRAGEETTTSQRLMIQTLLSLTEIRDAETGRHSRRIQEYTRVLAEQLATHAAFRDYLTPKQIDLLATLGPLHDIGKVGIPDHLLHKPGPLTSEERLELCKHPVYGRDVIVKAERDAGVRDDATLAVAKDIVYTHHEQWDGRGYPEGLRGTQIPIAGRLIAVVDVYDAVRSRRPYSEPISHDEAVVAIVKRGGTHFDPAVVEAFVKVSEAFRRLSEGAGLS